MSNPMTDVAEIARIKQRLAEIQRQSMRAEIRFGSPNKRLALYTEANELRAHLTQEQPR